MASKASSPGPNPTTAATPVNQARSRKATTKDADVGRAGPAGGIVLEKAKEAKSKNTPTPSKPATSTPASDEIASTPTKTPRRKPRKLNKDPTSASTPVQGITTRVDPAIEPPTATELEALKSRVRGLEAKVEELYKNGTLDRPGRSPRRRGKGRKNSSQQQVPTLASHSKQPKPTVEEDDSVEEIGRGNGDDAVDGDEEAEELVRLEGELETARQDLAAFRPRNTRKPSNQTYTEEDIEEIPRDDEGKGSVSSNRHVTLSGSYRIPLPASVSVDDVKHIQSGVSAAQNVARSFLEQRRAAAALNTSSSTSSPKSTPQAQRKTPKRPAPKSVSSSMEIAEVGGSDGKQSWSEWIGGYSVAISRAVKNIEHEAAVESQRVSTEAGNGSSGGAKKGTGGTKKGGNSGKRPVVKTKLNGEQVGAVMS